MLREINIETISDGKRYSLRDLARLGCDDCKGCSACCHGMGTSILLDPLDLARLQAGLSRSFEDMLEKEIELNWVDGIILPNLKMKEEEEACPFLNREGRCRIHAFRPGICRIFPLARLYEQGSFSYILQTGECQRQNRYKLRIRDWLDTPDPIRYDRYINDWHSFIRQAGQVLPSADQETRRQAALYILKLFYGKEYTVGALAKEAQEAGSFPYQDFYSRFYARLRDAREVLF